MQAMKKLGMALVISAGIGGAVVAAPAVANATVVSGGDLVQASGCYYNYQWYDVCPTFNVGGHDNNDDAQDRRRDRRRDERNHREDRNHHEDHGRH